MLCFDLYKDSRYYRSFVLKDEETNEIYRQTFKISFFELRKAVSELSQTKEVETFELSGLTARDQWALFINSGQQEVYEKLIEENKTFEEAYERLKKASSDETLMAMYRNREKAIRDWNDSINSARKDGVQQGEQRVNMLYERLLQENRALKFQKRLQIQHFGQSYLMNMEFNCQRDRDASSFIGYTGSISVPVGISI